MIVIPADMIGAVNAMLAQSSLPKECYKVKQVSPKDKLLTFTLTKVASVEEERKRVYDEVCC